jgi:hypothetical protein
VLRSAVIAATPAKVRLSLAAPKRTNVAAAQRT